MLCLFCLTTLSASAVTTYTALVMRTTLTNSTPSKSLATINDMFFTNPRGIKKFYEDASFGQATWTGTVIDVSIPYSTTDGSNSGTWADAAEQAARAKGYEPNNYTCKVTMVDADGQGTAGYAVGNGGTSRVFIYYSGDMSATAHEMGHSLGMDHAATDYNNDGVIDAEYGDPSDVMGGGAYTFNAPHKVQMGWMQSTTITVNGTYNVAPTEANNGNRAYVYNAGGAPYYFSYRQATGFDANTTWSDGGSKTPIGSPFTDGLSIHRFPGANTGNHTLLVSNPLTDGASYTIPGTSVVIHQNSHNSGGASFTVSGISGGGGGGFSGAGTYVLSPYAATGSALNDPSYSTTDPTQMVIWAKGGGGNEKFNFVDIGGGFYKVQCSFSTGQVLDAYGAGNNAVVGIWTDNGQNQQKWQVVSVGGGYYNLKPGNASTMALDNSNGASGNGNPLVLWPNDPTSNNQKWSFTKQ